MNSLRLVVSSAIRSRTWGTAPLGPGYREGAVGVPGAAREPQVLPVPLWVQADHLRPRLWSPVEALRQRLSRLIALVRYCFAAAGTAPLRAARSWLQFRRLDVRACPYGPAIVLLTPPC